MSHAYEIEGGQPLRGEVGCPGATKNSGLKCIAACLLAPGTSKIGRITDIADLRWFADVLKHLGTDLVLRNGVAEVTVPDELGVEAPYEYVSRMRASTAVIGPLLARKGRARVALPGGDFLGPRPIDIHLRGLEAMGAQIEVVHGFVEARAEELRGAYINLEYPSHGATENLLMAASLAKGTTTLENAARDPEISDLAAFLTAMGAKIDGQGSPTIVIEGVDSLSPADFEVMPDRIVAATYLFATATTGGEVTVRDMIPEHLARVLEVLADAGMTLNAFDDRVHIVADRRPKAVDVSTLPYPGFLTDLQPMAMAMATVADGMSIITENIYDNRFFHVDELARMGADIRVEKHYAAVRGVEELTGAEVRAADVSAGAALVIAGLAAKGRTRVEDIIHIDRRYERLEDALTSLGARMERVEGRGEAVAAPPRPPA